MTAGKCDPIESLKDETMRDGVFLINLCASIEPRAVNWNLVTSSETEEGRIRNAKYAVEIARNLDADLCCLWKDIFYSNSKKMLIVFASLMDVFNKSEEVYVKRWVDYSSKYGLAFELSNRTNGVFFNDSTKIILDPNEHHFNYYMRTKSDNQDIEKQYTMAEFPQELKKKVVLLKRFHCYLENHAKICETTPSSEPKERKVKDVVYVKKWIKTKHAMMFRLSNRVIQVNFQDETEIMVGTNKVTYVDKEGVRSTYPLNGAMDQDDCAMVKRLQYANNFMQQMLDTNGSTSRRGSLQDEQEENKISN